MRNPALEHLEPAAIADGTSHFPHPHCVALSQAISLKRIADALAPPGSEFVLLHLINAIAARGE